MKCETAQELISALVDDELSAAERTRVEAHTRTCAACAGAHVWLQETKTAVRTIIRHRHELPPGFWPALLRRLDAPHAAPSAPRAARYPWLARVPARAAMSFGIAAAVVGLALGIAWFTPMPEETTDAAVPVAVLVLDFEGQAAAAAPAQPQWGQFTPVGGPLMREVKHAPALMRPPAPHMTFVGHSTRYVNGVAAVQLNYASGPHRMALYQLPVTRARLPVARRAAGLGREFRVVRTERCCVVAWAEGDTAFALVSDLPPGGLLDMADALAAAADAPGA
ncbi:MAG: zf-HC2 domain-containing protein [Armatimonadota bacterium]|jgi:anti-sigma factor RsiW